MPPEGWGVKINNIIFVVKGFEHPDGCLHVVPKLIKGRKISNPWIKLPELVRFWRWSSCLLINWYIVCEYDKPEMVDPVERAEKLVNTSYKGTVLEELWSEAPSNVGVSGSLLYRNRAKTQSDVDIVVYGVLHSMRVLKRIRELINSGLLKPLVHDRRLLNAEYLRVVRGVTQYDFAKLLHGNPLYLFAINESRTYTVKLFAYTSGYRCPCPIARDRVKTIITIKARLTPPYVLPARYLVKDSVGYIEFYTVRMMYAALPLNIKLKVIGWLEQYRGFVRLTVDDGCVQVCPEARGDT